MHAPGPRTNNRLPLFPSLPFPALSEYRSRSARRGGQVRGFKDSAALTCADRIRCFNETINSG